MLDVTCKQFHCGIGTFNGEMSGLSRVHTKKKLLNLNKNHVNNFINIISNKIVIEKFFKSVLDEAFFR